MEMKLKIVIVDLEIPPHVKKWTLRLGLPLALLIAGGVAYADLPHPSWKDGDTLNAADLTNNFQYLQREIAGDGGVQAQISSLANTIQGDQVTFSAFLVVSPSGVTAGGVTWISAASRTNTGAVHLSLAVGAFSGAPQCAITSCAEPAIAVLPNVSKTTVDFQTYALSGSPVDTSLELICTGPR
jgi:hypothetical protein